jgi:hypothetical protein
VGGSRSDQHRRADRPGRGRQLTGTTFHITLPLSALLDQRNASISFTPDLLDIVFVEK